MSAVADYYSGNADRLAEAYESVTFEQVHQGALTLLPAEGVHVLDVGCGSGRDAAALAQRGHRVIGVDQCPAMIQHARRLHGEGVAWVLDSLPDLSTLCGHRFELILVSAVWMHLEPEQRARALSRLSDLLADDGQLLISLRFGPAEPARGLHRVSIAEIFDQADALDLVVHDGIDQADSLGRGEITWHTLALRRRRQPHKFDKAQRELARHALGLPSKFNRSYRNRFYAHVDGKDHAIWMDMVDSGLARRSRAPAPDFVWFWLTPKGAELALNAREKLCREDFPGHPCS